MQVEPGVTLRDVIRVALPDGWWPPVTPSTAEVTIGGCVAMNITGRNAWKCGSFGEHVLSLHVLLVSGQSSASHPRARLISTHAFVGSAGLLGIITSITCSSSAYPQGASTVLCGQWRRSARSSRSSRKNSRPTSSKRCWMASRADSAGPRDRHPHDIQRCRNRTSLRFPVSRIPEHLTASLARYVGAICRPAVKSGMRVANSVTYEWSARWNTGSRDGRLYFRAPSFHLRRLRATERFFRTALQSLQAFVPRAHAEALFSEILRRSRRWDFCHLWSVVKEHRPDPFLLSYQLDGFSLETYYQIVPQTFPALQKMLRELMDRVIAAGGRFYLAKDGLLTPALYRASIGDATVDAFLQLKRRYDPELLLQSDLFHRVFQTF